MGYNGPPPAARPKILKFEDCETPEQLWEYDWQRIQAECELYETERRRRFWRPIEITAHVLVRLITIVVGLSSLAFVLWLVYAVLCLEIDQNQGGGGGGVPYTEIKRLRIDPLGPLGLR